MKRKSLILSCAVVVASASVAGVSYAWMESGAAEGSPSRSIAVAGTADAERSLQTASQTVGFQADVPTFFPTSANRLVLVDSGSGPGSKVGGSLPLIELVYESDKKFSFKGQQLTMTIELFQMLARLNTPRGEKLAVSNANFDIYRDVVTKDDAGAPLKATYTAVGANKSFVIDFSGEQPSEEGIVKMLESMRPVPKTP